MRNMPKIYSCYSFIKIFIVSIVLNLNISLVLSIENGVCNGPASSTELAKKLFGSESSYSETKLDRPNVAKLYENATSKMIPSLAEPDVVKVQLHVLSIKELNQLDGTFEIVLWLRQKWNDYRLQYPTISEGGCFEDGGYVGFSDKQLQYIWSPQVVVANSISDPVISASSFWLLPNGDVLHSQNMKLILECAFNLLKFPQDVQDCKVILETWNEDASKVVLELWEDLPPITYAVDSLIGTSSSEEWTLQFYNASTSYFTQGTLTRETIATFQFTLARDSSYYINFIIIPVIMMVILSWSSFFIDRGAAPARVTMSTVCFLTITNYLGSQVRALPHHSGDKVWMLRFLITSTLFSFIAVLEYVICNYLFRVEKRLKVLHQSLMEQRKEQAQKTGEALFAQDKDEIMLTKQDFVEAGAHKIDRLVLKGDGTMYFKDQNIEIFFRWAFPFAYALAIIIFWSQR